MDHILLIHSSVVGICVASTPWLLVSNAAVNVGVHCVLLQFLLFGSLGYTPRGRVSGSRGSSVFNFLRNLQSFCTLLHHVTSPPTSPACISCVLTDTCSFLSFLFCAASLVAVRCEVVSPCGFDVHSQISFHLQ